MVTNGTVKNSCVVDVCYSCGAKFLDGGELEKIRSEFKTEAERSAAFNTLFIDKYGAELNKNSEKVDSFGKIWFQKPLINHVRKLKKLGMKYMTTCFM